jgi:ribosomal protein L9
MIDFNANMALYGSITTSDVALAFKEDEPGNMEKLNNNFSGYS